MNLFVHYVLRGEYFFSLITKTRQYSSAQKNFYIYRFRCNIVFSHPILVNKSSHIAEIKPYYYHFMSENSLRISILIIILLCKIEYDPVLFSSVRSDPNPGLLDCLTRVFFQRADPDFFSKVGSEESLPGSAATAVFLFPSFLTDCVC